MKLTTITNVSVDGVMQGLGGSDEDRGGGFERDGWALPLFDDEATTVMGEIYRRADAFLFGRRTYEIFAGSWGTGSWGMEEGDNPISVALNTRPKYVASNTLADPRWADTTVLSGDVAAAIGALKAKPGGELQVHGSGALVRWLFGNRLVDEITLFTYPVVVGQGKRLFPDNGSDSALELVDSRAPTPKGVPQTPPMNSWAGLRRISKVLVTVVAGRASTEVRSRCTALWRHDPHRAVPFCSRPAPG